MTFPAGNPYPPDSAEFLLWERWHRSFFAEPVHAQLYEIEAQLQAALSALLQTTERVAAPEVRAELRTLLLRVEETILLVNEAAEHAYQRVVSAPAQAPNGRDPDE